MSYFVHIFVTHLDMWAAKSSFPWGRKRSSLPARSAALSPLPRQEGARERVTVIRSRKIAASATKPLTPTLSRKGRGGRSATVARSQRAAERLMQQRFFQRVERGEFLLVEGFEALGFG